MSRDVMGTSVCERETERDTSVTLVSPRCRPLAVVVAFMQGQGESLNESDWYLMLGAFSLPSEKTSVSTIPCFLKDTNTFK